MLKLLSVENYALIRKIEIQFSQGFHVITGETGAGKSIIVGALSLLMGQRADTSMVAIPEKKCIVEGVFDISEINLKNYFEQIDIDYENSLIIRREINPQGKSRAFINDTPVSLNILKEISSKLFDIHSQHENLLFSNKDFQLNLIDQYAQNHIIKKQYTKQYSDYKTLLKELKELKEKEAKTLADSDYYNFLFNELEEANLKENELQQIENELIELQNVETIKQQFQKIDAILNTSEYNVIDLLKEIKTSLNEIKNYCSPAKEIYSRINSVFIELDDVASEISRFDDNFSHNPEKISDLSQRQNLLNHLCTKHRVNTDSELIDIKNEIEQKLLQLSFSSEKLEKCNIEFDKCKKELILISEKLSKSRLDVLSEVCKEISKTAIDLGMPDVQLQFNHSLLPDFSSLGIDHVDLLFTANLGMSLRPLDKIASGGELSRIMLAIKSIISEKNLIPIIIFDEIDTGVSGDIASKVAQIMKKMAENMQLIAITHLPQIAAKANTHFWVHKIKTDGNTESNIKILSDDERVLEIAKMISNDTVTEVSIMASKELLNNQK